MKKKTTLLIFCLMANVCLFATGLYWVGPANGNWNNSNNWSATADGPGGAGTPGAGDSAIISSGSSVDMDVSPTIGSLSVSHGQGGSYSENVVKLYTSSGCTLSILDHLFISFVTLIDSTSEDVPFNVVLKGATNATGLINYNGGSWTFKGRVPVTNGNGATFTAEPGSVFTVRQYGAIISGANSARISCDPSSLIFAELSQYIVRSNLDAMIPNATFAPDFLINPGVPPEFYQFVSGASIYIEGKIGSIKYSGSSYRSLNVNLYEQTADASLALPNGCNINVLGIGSTNGHTITLFTNTGNATAISGNIRTFAMGGNDTKVALANSTASTAATDYLLQVAFFSQSGGNFSLQDYNNPLGGSTLAVSRDFLQTDGTFHTNSTTTNDAVKFVLEMNGGDFFSTRIYGVDSRGQSLSVSSGTINNEQNHVTLRINTPLVGYNGYFFVDKGVTLKRPLTVGRLELLKGPLNTTDTSLITVNDPGAATGITTAIAGESYVIGPLSRMTNSTGAYTFPLGKPGVLRINDYFRPSVIVPSSNVSSSYSAEYVNTEYRNLKVAAPLRGISSAEYWNISKLSGADASIGLPLKKPVSGASAADGIVIAHFVNGQWIPEHGTVLRPGTADSGFVVSKPISTFSPFTFGLLSDGNLPHDTILNAFTCPKDSIIYVETINCLATLNWTAPAAVFADSYNIGNGDKLTLKGVFNGHGYYESGANYLWTDARKIAGDAGGYLVTINSEAENNFIVNKVIGPNRQAYRWIGLYNTGKAGQFSWITGEPLSYTNWIPGEPNNYYNNTFDTTIYEPYGHLNGYDSLNRWNDIGNISARFLAEFDSHIDTYRQYSGPGNGQLAGPGSNTICYERTNRLSGKRDSCCFTFTVVCKNNTARANDISGNAGVSNTLEAVAYPNPSSTSFLLNLKHYNQNDYIKMEVTDALGRIVEVNDHINTKSQVQFGSDYGPGFYFLRITQRNNVIVLKLVKK